jgi:hypothetical protein
MEYLAERRDRTRPGDVVIALGEEQWDAKLCLAHEVQCFRVLTHRKFLVATEAFHQVTRLEHE